MHTREITRPRRSLPSVDARLIWFGLKICLFLIPFFTGCHSPYAALQPAPDVSPECIQRLRPVFSSKIYKTEVDVVGKQLSGLLVFKTMPDSSRRVVFTSETGPTLFDFEFNRGAFRVLFCQKKLNRKAVLRTLRKDFELLLMENPGRPEPVLRDSQVLYFPFRAGKETNYYRTDTACSRLLGMEKAGRRKKKVLITLSPFESGMPEHVQIEHRNFTFAIRLTAFERNAPD